MKVRPVVIQLRISFSWPSRFIADVSRADSEEPWTEGRGWSILKEKALLLCPVITQAIT
jgi:hypothetical protein